MTFMRSYMILFLISLLLSVIDCPLWTFVVFDGHYIKSSLTLYCINNNKNVWNAPMEHDRNLMAAKTRWRFLAKQHASVCVQKVFPASLTVAWCHD